MATNVDLSGDTLYVTDVVVNSNTPGVTSGISLAGITGTSSEAVTITSTSANALTVGRQGATAPVLKVDASASSVATGVSVTGAAAASGVAVAAISSGTDENLTINAKGAGTITLNNTATGAVAVSRNLGVTGTNTTTSASANALAVGLAGATNPALNVDASTASSATGLNVKSAAATGGVALSAISSGTPENMTIDAKGTGTLTLQGTATGVTNVNHGLTVAGGTITSAAGTTSIAPVTLTSGTNLTTAAAGAIEYDGNAIYATSTASARQAVPGYQYILQGADSSAANNTLLDSASASPVFVSPANGAVTLTAGKTYLFEGVYLLTNTGTTSHTWGVNFGGTATFSAGTGYMATGSSGVTASTPIAPVTGFISSTTLTTNVVVTAASTSATEQVTAHVKGVLVINAGGTVIPRMQASARPGASGTPGVVVKAGSYFRITQLGATPSVGNWS